jgi:hypothetical protein
VQDWVASTLARGAWLTWQLEEKSMSRQLITTMTLLALVTAANAATHEAILVSEGYLEETGDYYSQWYICISLDPGEDWQAAQMTATIDPSFGVFYQHPFDVYVGNPPDPFWFTIFPDVEYTSYYTSPGDYPNGPYYGSLVAFTPPTMYPANPYETETFLWAEWYDIVDVPGPGDFVIAQVTVLPTEPYEWFAEVSLTSIVIPYAEVSDTLFLGSGGGNLVADPDTLDFGDVPVGDTSAPQTVTVTNNTGEYLEVSAYTWGPGEDDFDCTPEWTDIPHGQSEDFDVTFSPSAPGSRDATLTFEGWYWWEPDPNWPGEYVLWGSIDVELSGVGIATSLDIDPEAVDFGNVFIGQTSDPETLTLINNCGMEVEVVALTLSGTNPEDFEISSAPPLPFTIPDGQSETLELTFSPSAWSTRQATLTIESPDLTEDIDVPLSGYGVCFGDLDDDGDVDLSDLAQLLTNYGTTSGAAYEDGDLDGDGDVDLTDLAGLLAVYGTSCP